MEQEYPKTVAPQWSQHGGQAGVLAKPVSTDNGSGYSEEILKIIGVPRIGGKGGAAGQN